MESSNQQPISAGDKHYKAYIGPPSKYDLVSAMQFNLVTAFGIRDSDKLLDIGCGSLRFGKLMIPYLQRGNYFGIEPNEWLIEDGVKNELGQDILTVKQPRFMPSDSFELSAFEVKFDYMVAQSIFSHTSQAQIHQCLKEVKATLKATGVLLATFVEGDTNYEGEEWVYPGCVTFTQKHIKDMVKKDGLETIRTTWGHPNRQTWYAIFHPENKASVKARVKNLHRANKVSLPLKERLKRYRIINNKLILGLYRVFKPLPQ